MITYIKFILINWCTSITPKNLCDC